MKTAYHMPDPDMPVLLSFSGGRTSGFMLHCALQAHGGKLPSNWRVVFFNTGKEMPQTLDFVNECALRWGVDVVWLEYCRASEKDTKQVNYETAARNGEPFEELIKYKKFLPNPVARFCTQELKIRRGKQYMLRQGFEHWFNVVGFRFDEARRWMNYKGDKKERFTSVFPLVVDEISVNAVTQFWHAQDFDLRLPNANGKTPLGNCDLCYLKGTRRITSILREFPQLGDWWARMENETPKRLKCSAAGDIGATFRKGGISYATMQLRAKQQGSLLDLTDDPIADCMCVD